MTAASKASIQDVRRALEETGCQEDLELAGERVEEYVAQVAAEIDEFVSEYARRFGETSDPFELLEENPDKAAGFFRAIAGTAYSLDFRIAIWRILAGARIGAVNLGYERQRQFQLCLELEWRDGGNQPDGPRERYESDRLWDFQVLKHVSMIVSNGKPILEFFDPE
ncbi:MAG TPA: hypothetical protein VML55_18365 [Planctomycetaceae bacterium]|nr:hypothetical protein [Planctomycetaceae bacterium]